LLTAPRGLSQRATSFIACNRQGIHQTPFSKSLEISSSRPRSRTRDLLSMIRHIFKTSFRTNPGRCRNPPRGTCDVQANPAFTISSESRSRKSEIRYPTMEIRKQKSAASDSGFRFLVSDFCRAFGTAWWSRSGSNRRPQACKASALPTELRPRRRRRDRNQNSEIGNQKTLTSGF
jgi:hypothetical protein